jgi:hypothetical protein
MRDTETRIAAVELMLVWLGAWTEPDTVRNAMRSIAPALRAPGSEAEAEVWLHTLKLLRIGLSWFGPAAGGAPTERAN